MDEAELFHPVEPVQARELRAAWHSLSHEPDIRLFLNNDVLADELLLAAMVMADVKERLARGFHVTLAHYMERVPEITPGSEGSQLLLLEEFMHEMKSKPHCADSIKLIMADLQHKYGEPFESDIKSCAEAYHFHVPEAGSDTPRVSVPKRAHSNATEEGRSLIDSAIAGDRIALERLLLREYQPLLIFIRSRVSSNRGLEVSLEFLIEQTLFRAAKGIRELKLAPAGDLRTWLREIAEDVIHVAGVS